MHSFLGSLFSGFIVSLGLIVAIGAQNAFVLRQGIKGQHVVAVVLTCILSSAILISIGIGGFSLIRSTLPWIEEVSKYGGAAFLLVYGVMSLKKAFGPEQALVPSKDTTEPLVRTLLTCLALTWLNPHVYLDTVLLMGLISTQHENYSDAFAIGAITASTVFFSSLGFAATKLRPVFAKPISWRILEMIIAVIMFSIAIKLLFL